MWTAVHAQFEALDGAAKAGFESLDDLAQLGLCLGHGVVAQRLTSAADADAADAVDVEREADLCDAVDHLLHAVFGNPREDEVLLSR